MWIMNNTDIYGQLKFLEKNINQSTIFISHFGPLQPVLLDQGYIHLKNQVIKAERRVLKELGFCVHVKHPHKVYMFIWLLFNILKLFYFYLDCCYVPANTGV